MSRICLLLLVVLVVACFVSNVVEASELDNCTTDAHCGPWCFCDNGRCWWGCIHNRNGRKNVIHQLR
ncbi:hypothetical protein TSAR_003309 [Trichomalopsis sarcophagae]|uniref:Uncharacterized protein n=1 Tax=Trichomalopsis sarcophagae TaxID=543379 RepID=A0A232F5Q7_9HYME|nr:hypothetical protein TSAR_003309 [Trichomalopsis sarcophagae]